MKKTLFYIICPFVALIAVTPFLPRPVHKAPSLSGHIVVSKDTIEPEDTSILNFANELAYYFSRHNVQDEGYEMVAAFADGKRLEVKVSPYISALNVGTWKNRRRQGTGVALDSLGRTIVGTFQADTLTTGIRPDSTGTYRGDFVRLAAQGHGAYQHFNGSYFEGHWESDLRHGFGLEMQNPLGSEPRLRVGEWLSNRFWGERMRYTTERIYGIDIARYQHEQGRRRFPIDWSKMRITFLGKKSHKNVKGDADYPVSFVFIKSTEGVTIRNRYYASDYHQARKHGIRTGAYHFWRTKLGGAQQARFFLRNTLFGKGDLPPVLDVEPSDAQIRAAGGPEAMFRQIRTWLRMVEQHTGVKPILYINQRFVNMYLPVAPDIKRDYRVWIARYGEYKPDVRLAFWQLCPDGRVAGIRPEVDINVFNGYQTQFDEFLEQETIK